MRAELLKMLVQSHANGDDDGFRKAALQLAAAESAAGHGRIAEDLRAIVGKMGSRPARREGAIVDIAQPRGELADVLEGGHRDERLRDIVLRIDIREKIERVISENRLRAKLEQWGVQPRRRVLFHGPPGCGKSLAAAVLAGEMSLPLMTVRFDAMFSRFLGATASHLRAIFMEMPRRPAVYFFDEFDAVAKARGDTQDVGEMNRIVTAFLQLIDADRSGSLIVAATNHAQLLDRAIWRRFDLTIPFEKPEPSHIEALLNLRLSNFGLDTNAVRKAVEAASELSFANVARACDDAIRTMALGGRERIATSDLVAALKDAHGEEMGGG
jgi:SpoVK/Ycf46/Vps4 family AAA+-type ATPase